MVPLFLLHAVMIHPTGYYERHRYYHDPYGHGAPHPGTTPAVPHDRVLAMLMPNVNLFYGFEHIRLFDPILNRRYRDFMLRHFPGKIHNPEFAWHVNAPPAGAELDALQILGVNRVDGYIMPPDDRLRNLSGMNYELTAPLPRAFIIPEAEFTAINRDWKDLSAPELRARLRHAAKDSPVIVPRPTKVNSQSYMIPEGVSGRLVVNQMHSTNWILDGGDAFVAAPSSPEPLADLFPPWHIESKDATTVRAAYWPRGLNLALPLALGGAIAICAISVGLHRQNRYTTR